MFQNENELKDYLQSLIEIEKLKLRLRFNSLNDREKAQYFHLNQLSKVKNNNLLVPFLKGPKLLIHFIPLNFYAVSNGYDLSKYSQSNKIYHETLLTDIRYNFDGLLGFYNVSDKDPAKIYIQLYKNGIIELVRSLEIPERMELLSLKFIENYLIESIKHYLEILEDLGVKAIVIFYISLVDVKGFIIKQKTNFFMGKFPKIDKEILDLPELMIKDFKIKPKKFLKSHFDRLWNAAGYSKSGSYDKDGNWDPKDQ